MTTASGHTSVSTASVGGLVLRMFHYGAFLLTFVVMFIFDPRFANRVRTDIMDMKFGTMFFVLLSYHTTNHLLFPFGTDSATRTILTENIVHYSMTYFLLQLSGVWSNVSYAKIFISVIFLAAGFVTAVSTVRKNKKGHSLRVYQDVNTVVSFGPWVLLHTSLQLLGGFMFIVPLVTAVTFLTIRKLYNNFGASNVICQLDWVDQLVYLTYYYAYSTLQGSIQLSESDYGRQCYFQSEP